MDSKEAIIQKLNKISYWFQYFEVAPGIFTPGANNVEYICEQMHLPKDLTGMSVLDVGAYDGGFSFECERRGASRVIAYDLPDPNSTGFNVAKEILASNVEYVRGSVYKLDPKEIGTFDIVLFAGVLYHLRYPLLACDRLRSVTEKFCFIETQVIDNWFVTPDGVVPLSKVAPKYTSLPICQFYEHGELGNDTSNWFSPNIAAVLAWFRSAGFDIKHLSSWGGRAAFSAEVLSGLPQYQQSISYEGMVAGNSKLSVL
ncbi:MAG: class I SAM-dependent methyltransferase [Cyanomargarita calcarea GSE-NOS-MK-12-04C]|jgi:tRNA (mo5U34)-methyltransferase|uniref:Class I SAM-dependent methyltransferase n=1 Tax=Cyanomargarita calcarea GSE-NOS-MK-12-04C TaxID=2839659 RepID=A0A951QM97_9CYAN|nr:class I SAM-dependent methyltransferase [Cyanomargarita calcarea GSE-NOS-MK-12-04C]